MLADQHASRFLHGGQIQIVMRPAYAALLNAGPHRRLQGNVGVSPRERLRTAVEFGWHLLRPLHGDVAR